MRMMERPASARLALVGLLFLGACGGSGPGQESGTLIPSHDLWPGGIPGEPVTERPGCGILDGPASPGGKFLVVLADSVRPEFAPVPGNPSERLVFAHMYETLVRVACSGEIQPGLAESWTCTEDSTVWVFRLRPDARFWDGTRVTSEDVRAAWKAAYAGTGQGDRPGPWSWFDARSSSITTPDARRVAIQLPEPQAQFPQLLAHPATAVAVRRDGWTWPVGSGVCRLRASDPVPRPDIACRANLHHPRAPLWTLLTFRIQPGADPRDLLGNQPDLLMVRETDDAGFYRKAVGYEAHPMPWDRLYLLVTPPEANPDGPGRWYEAASRVDPARDVTSVEARKWYDLVLPGGGSETCPQISGPVGTPTSARRDWGLQEAKPGPQTLLFPAGYPGARQLGHRLVALVGKPARAVSLPPDAVDFALQWQMSGALIIPLDLAYPTGCLQLATLLGKASWLQDAALGQDDPWLSADSLGDAERMDPAGPHSPAENLRGLGLVRPLGLSRPWLVTRGELGGLGLDYDGTLRLEALGRALPTTVP